jgi:hypothetical protein
MEARMLAEITWDAKTAFAKPDAASRFVDWWSREYFGESAAADVAASYRGYYQALSSWEQIAVGGNAVLQTLGELEAKLSGKPVPAAAAAPPPASAQTSPEPVALEQRKAAYDRLLRSVSDTVGKLTGERRQFLFEHVMFPLQVDALQTAAAVKLRQALADTDPAETRRLSILAWWDLRALEGEIRAAERAPFEDWYRRTWIRDDNSPYNLHRSYQKTLAFLIEHYLTP